VAATQRPDYAVEAAEAKAATLDDSMNVIYNQRQQGGTSPTDFTLHDAQHSHSCGGAMADHSDDVYSAPLCPTSLALLFRLPTSI